MFMMNYLSKHIKHYLVRHEQAAVHAAEGYARVSGKCGIALVTSGRSNKHCNRTC
ncbi:MAG: thiamine pyrophosphate-binding protein [Candidatus Gastranaerophilaceae bacterium]